ncbi:hypothetical protein BAMA_04305 [Bacillus manliponensis]|uniref:Uncharacterized protein n=1 Tax=Bacillus manliponensis TaxID=574376 RepID=A0A073JUJ8_9BACI|nr:hypothetical protein [Bacillus manliponensis]KEK18734.1 hypothetical protein BAMA_04305 [Bacillus manliponensis]
MPTFLKENNKVGKWSFKIEKFVFVAIPALCIAFYPLFEHLNALKGQLLPSYMYPQHLYIIAPLIFGYVLITVVEKKSIAS